MAASAHEEKMLNLQHQLRHNQSELQDYLAGLDNWTSEMKEKEKKLKSDESGKKTSDLPPVRNTIEKKKMKKKKKEKPIDPNKPKRISGFDFRAWDKFDVDKALEEVDGNEKKTETSSSEYETDEEWEMERKKHLAELEKDKGNKFLKNGDFDRAVEAYTKGMEFDATNSILPANRALALIKQQKFAAAELDCTSSIVLDPLYVKAYLRRATARAGVGRVQDAMSDYGRVLDLEPANKQAKAELERLEKELSREKEGPVQSSFTEGQRGVVKPVYKSPEERSKVPLKRIEIEEIGVEVASRPHRSAAEQSEMVKRMAAKEEQAFDSRFTSSSASRPPTDALVDSHPPDKIKAVVEKPASVCDAIDSGTHKPNSISAQEPSDSESSTKLPSGNASQTQPSQRAENSDKTHTAKRRDTKPTEVKIQTTNHVTGSGSLGGADGRSFQVPQSSFQFQADFKLLKKKPEQFFHYFQAIPPAQYSNVFGQCLDADILNAVLNALALCRSQATVDLFEVLQKLTVVKRFTVTAMFLSNKDKQVVADLLTHIADTGQHTEEELKDLRQHYQL